MRSLGSLGDQVLVSGGNFLTIAICAHALPLSEQGKFTYVFASYMALLLLNVAGIFQGAAVRAPVQDDSYRVVLARLQLFQALLFSLLICGVWFGCGRVLGWQATDEEAGLLFIFLILQQMADFDRRTAYIFSSVGRAVYSSAALYPLRIIGLLFVRPTTLSQVLLVLIVSTLVPAMLSIICVVQRITSSWTDAVKEHLVYSRLFIAGAPLGWMWAYTPIFLLGIIHGKEQAALLASIRGISNVANVLMEQLETKVIADWARIHHSKGVNAIESAGSRLLKLGMLFWLSGMMIITLFGREIVVLVLGNLYAMHWHLLLISWGAYGVYFFARVTGIKHRSLGANHIEFIGNLCGVVAAMMAGFMLIPALKAAGAAWVYVVVSTVMLISQILAVNNGRLVSK